MEYAKTGGEVPPAGPLTRLLSANISQKYLFQGLGEDTANIFRTTPWLKSEAWQHMPCSRINASKIGNGRMRRTVSKS